MILLDLLYPPRCLHCDAMISKAQPLCAECLETLSLIPQEGRCSKCFSEIAVVQGVCKPCRQIAHPFAKLTSCFDSFGPAQSLVSALLNRGSFHFAKDIASFLVVQLEQMQYPPIDLITLVPGYFRTPFDPVAKELARIVKHPFQNLLKRELTPYPSFSIRKNFNIINKTVLLLDIQMQTRATIRSAAWALDRGMPEGIYGLTFCCN